MAQTLTTEAERHRTQPREGDEAAPRGDQNPSQDEIQEPEAPSIKAEKPGRAENSEELLTRSALPPPPRSLLPAKEGGRLLRPLGGRWRCTSPPHFLLRQRWRRNRQSEGRRRRRRRSVFSLRHRRKVWLLKQALHRWGPYDTSSLEFTVPTHAPRQALPVRACTEWMTPKP